MRLSWLWTGFAAVIILASGGLSWAQQRPDEAAFRREGEGLSRAFSNCLWSHTRRLADGKTPTQANGDAAVAMCASEEEALRNFLLRMPGLEKGVLPGGPHAGRSIDLVVLCTRQHMVWGIVGFDERLRRDESVPLYQIDPRCR